MRFSGLCRHLANRRGGVRDAMRREPWYVAGTDRFDTDVMRETGAIVAKGGAEGVFLAGDTRTGRGFALKVIDGNSRAVAPAPSMGVSSRPCAAMRSRCSETFRGR